MEARPRPDWTRIEPLLERCLGLAEAERAAFLRAEARPDEAHEVLRLIAMERRADAQERLLPPTAEVLVGALDSVESASPGTCLGPWRLIERVGEGGMGVVWRGERADGAFSMRVAVKLLKISLGLADRELRFDAELRILAALEHPGIARLLDGGRSEDGTRYLVLEFVDGDPIDTWCDRRRLALDDRIRLFLGVCDAVQHAHERGVLHRDLKPGNVLVGADGSPRLVDFGIAKVVGEVGQIEGLESPGVTRTGQRLYTPRYASPEQVRGEPTSAPADVYSLGVLLYELLTGYAPCPAKGSSQFALERATLEEDPARPSTVIEASGHDEPPWVVRGLPDRRSLRARLTGDLDWILLAALRKEPDRRYATVGDFADDLRRHLAREPVAARPESRVYRARRFVERHRGLTAGTAATILALGAGLLVALVLYRDALRARATEARTAYRASLVAAEGELQRSAAGVAAAALGDASPELRGWEWRHLSTRADRSLHRWTGIVTSEVSSGVAVSPDGARLAVALAHDRLEWIDLESGRREEALELSVAGGAAWRPDGGELAVGGQGQVSLVDPVRRSVVGTIAVPDTLSVDVVYAPTEPHLAWGSYDGTVAVHDLERNVELARWQAHGRGQLTLRYSPTGHRLASASWDGDVKVWEAASGRHLATLRGHERWVTGLDWTQDGERIATSSLDGTVGVWDADSGALLVRERLHRGGVSDVAVLPGDTEAISVGYGGQVLRWMLDSGKQVTSLIGHTGLVQHVAVDGVRGRLVTAGTDGVRCWSLLDEDVPTRSSCEYSKALVLSPDGTEVAITGGDGRIRRWTSAGEPLEWSDLPPSTGGAVGHRATLGWGVDGLVSLSLERDAYELRRVEDGTALARVARSTNADRAIAVAPVPASPLLAVFGADALLVDLRSGRRTELVDEGGQALSTSGVVAMRPDGGELAASRSGQVLRWSLPSGAYLGQWEACRDREHGAVTALAYEPGSGRLVAGCSDGSAEGFLAIWEPDTDGPPSRVPIAAQLRSLAFHPQEQRLFVGQQNGDIRVLESQRLETLVLLRGHSGPVGALRFTPDGDTLVSCGGEGTVRFWTAD
ncbi:protein kinase domain-containing protein [Engelhardtia mirabilis]|uniref:Serine/threonine-protein kinase PknA n=1 Tax=Engelhardtia mirabilis TaxID=2528011 RepID=A0A518BGW4_9BACT|nr:Serine/threonine-protein kinase PknA [Planctomycetes bacterium Pla133]QDV00542.1 Serine/threonine-protein kinase PknA [Planctomycetes bacterium Pla86]